jgi:hypothetical protein
VGCSRFVDGANWLISRARILCVFVSRGEVDIADRGATHLNHVAVGRDEYVDECAPERRARASVSSDALSEIAMTFLVDFALSAGSRGYL